jgi:hypothetical protein
LADRQNVLDHHAANGVELKRRAGRRDVATTARPPEVDLDVIRW